MPNSPPLPVSIPASLTTTETLIKSLTLASHIYGLSTAIHSSSAAESRPESRALPVDEWRDLGERLEGVRTRLVVSMRIEGGAGCLMVEEEVIEGLRERCAVLVGDLGVRISRVMGLGNLDREAFRIIWGIEDLQVLGKRVIHMQGQVEAVVVPFLRKSIDWVALSPLEPEIGPELKQVFEIIKMGHLVFSDDVKQSLLTDGSKDHRPPHDPAVLPHVVYITEKLSTEQQTGASWDPDVHALSDKADGLHDFILGNLSFQSMRDREEEVAEAHRRTFEWIFESTQEMKPGSNFLQWLKDDHEGIYWINGKAGSGKSTLMRFIHENEKTVEQLKLWAGERPLTVAGFFFWTSGSLEQRSQVGLLRYLLFQLLNQHRLSIPIVFPELWEQLWHAKTKDRIKITITWSLPSLKISFQNFLSYAAGKMKICLLVDGLDEFNGNHEEIVDLFKGIVDSSQNEVKVCLSSRPWAVFEKAFSSIPSLKLQDLTLDDMTQYVDHKLSNNPIIRRIVRKEPEQGAKLVADVVRNADGVFLWVILVVRSLLLDLQTSDKVSNLQDRLAVLPTNLDSLFQYSLFDIQPEVCVTSACRLFKILRAREVICDFTGDQSAASLTLWELALADGFDEVADQTLAVNQSVRETTPEEVLERCRGSARRLTGDCAGLLEIHNRQGDRTSDNRARFDNPDSAAGQDGTIPIQGIMARKITYLHRTVRDFLVQPQIWALIQYYTAIPFFDAHLAHLRASILILKLPIGEPERHRRLDEWWPLIVVALTHARYVSPGVSSTPDANALVAALDETLSWYWLSRSSKPMTRKLPSFASSFSDSFRSPTESTASSSAPPDQDAIPLPQNPDHWATSAFYSYEIRAKLPPITSPFLALCTKFGLHSYLAQILSQNKYHYDLGSVPLLTHAIQNLVSRRSTVYPLSSIPMLRTLLSSAETSDPNTRYPIRVPAAGKTATMSTPWLEAAECVRQATRKGWIEYYDVDTEGTRRWAEILSMLVSEGGADVKAFIEQNKWDERASVLDIVEAVWKGVGGVEVGGVRELLLARGAGTEEK